jgi:hypothetical protein
VNDLFDLLEKGGHADKVKLLGIGAGNSAMEVDIFRAKFEPRFPLVPDQDFTVHDACGGWARPISTCLPGSPRGGIYCGHKPPWAHGFARIPRQRHPGGRTVTL